MLVAASIPLLSRVLGKFEEQPKSTRNIKHKGKMRQARYLRLSSARTSSLTVMFTETSRLNYAAVSDAVQGEHHQLRSGAQVVHLLNSLRAEV